MRSRVIGIIGALSAVFAACAGGQPQPARQGPAADVVPRAVKAPVLDGAIDAEEWSTARSIPIEGGLVRLMADDRALYVAISGGGAGIASVLIAIGGRMWILHASAALGMAGYARGTTGTWIRDRDFLWEARNPDDTAARERFYKTNAWLGNVSPEGADREFEIGRALLGDGSSGGDGNGNGNGNGNRNSNRAVQIIAAYLFTREEPMRLSPWPKPLRDDAANIDLHAGSAPPTAHFSPETWASIALP